MHTDEIAEELVFVTIAARVILSEAKTTKRKFSMLALHSLICVHLIFHLWP